MKRQATEAEDYGVAHEPEVPPSSAELQWAPPSSSGLLSDLGIDDVAQLLAPRRSVPGCDPRRAVLVVDDDILFLRALARRLSEHYLVLRATNARAAQRIVERCPVALIVSDYDLDSELSGLELLRTLRERHPGVRRVLISGTHLEHIVDQESEVVESFLFKGGDPEPLVVCVRDMLRGAHAC